MKDARGQRRADERRRVSRLFTGRGAGIGSRWQVLGADSKMKVLTSASETGWIVQRGTLPNGSATGRGLGRGIQTVESRSPLMLMVLSRNKLENSSARSGSAYGLRIKLTSNVDDFDQERS